MIRSNHPVNPHSDVELSQSPRYSASGLDGEKPAYSQRNTPHDPAPSLSALRSKVGAFRSLGPEHFRPPIESRLVYEDGPPLILPYRAGGGGR